MMVVTIIAALGLRGELGGQGGLLWKIPEDLKNFKDFTVGGTVIMGRKTWESLPLKPLPDRHCIVITRRPDYEAPGAEVRVDLISALCELWEAKDTSEVFIIGGGEIYRQALPLADTLYLTRVFQSFPEADTFFPDFPDFSWKLLSESEVECTESGLSYQFQTWVRVD